VCEEEKMDEKLREWLGNVCSDIEQFIFVNTEGDLVIQRGRIIDRLGALYYGGCEDQAKADKKAAIFYALGNLDGQDGVRLEKALAAAAIVEKT
jgi:hypothetical protein